MIQDILIPFIAVGLAELGDKTQLAVLCLASKTKEYSRLFLGVMLGFFITDGLAVLLGSMIVGRVPENIIRLVSGGLFIGFGVWMLIQKTEEESCDLKSPFLSGFLLILMCEMGDKTQIVSGLFATRFEPILVLAGVLLSLATVSVMAIYLGKTISGRIDRKKMSIAAGTVFIILGILSFF